MQANPPSAQPATPAQQILVSEMQVAAPFLQRVLSDAGGNPSSMRLAMLLGLVIVLAAWLIVSVQARALQPLPDSIVTLLSVLVGGKFAQKFIEPKDGPVSPIPSPAPTGGSPGDLTVAGAPAQPIPPNAT